MPSDHQLVLELAVLPLKLPDLVLVVLKQLLSFKVSSSSTPSSRFKSFLIRQHTHKLRRKFLDLVLLEVNSDFANATSFLPSYSIVPD